MNGLYIKTPELNFLQWRKQDVEFQLEEYLPFILSKLNTKYSECSGFEINDLPGTYDTDGFKYDNLKLLQIKLKTIGGEQDIGVKLPMPSPNDDIFTINRNNYILTSLYTDDLFYFYNKTLHTISFRIYPNGSWAAFKGSQVKNQKLLSIASIAHSLGILTNWFKEYAILGKSEEVPKGSKTAQLKNGDIFVYKLADEYSELTLTHDLFIASLDVEQIKSFDGIDVDGVMKRIIEQNPFEFSFEYEFTHGYSDLETLYFYMLKEYENEEYHRFEEIHLSFKRIKYYQQVLSPIANKIKSIRNIFNKAKNLSTDISWKQRIPANVATKFLKKYKYLQYLELNPFIEIDVKHKIVTPLDNVPKYMRSTAYSGVKQICPLNSPDSANIGVVQSMASSCTLDPYGKFLNVESIL